MSFPSDSAGLSLSSTKSVEKESDKEVVKRCSVTPITEHETDQHEMAKQGGVQSNEYDLEHTRLVLLAQIKEATKQLDTSPSLNASIQLCHLISAASSALKAINDAL